MPGLLLALHALLVTPRLSPLPLWSVGYDGPAHSEDRVTGLLADSAGNCYLAGYSFGGATDFDFGLVKVNPAGETVWTRRYGSPYNCEDRIWSSAFDRTGNVIVCGGTIADSTHGWDFQLASYAPDGDTLWLRRYDFPDHGDDKPAAVAVAADNSIVVTGSARHRPVPTVANRTDWDIALLRLTPLGDTLWSRLADGGTDRDDHGIAVAVDSAADIYVAAKATGAAGSTDIALLKYAPDGRLLWQRILDGPGRANDFPLGLLLDQKSRPVVFGATTGKGTSFDYSVAVYEPDGTPTWHRTWDGNGRVDIAHAACTDPAGNIIVTGQSTGLASSLDMATLSYAPDGTLNWLGRYNGPENRADRGWCVAAADSGHVFVGGSSDGMTGYPDLVLLSLSGTGDTVSTFRYSGGGLGESKPVAVYPMPGRILVAGCANRPQTGFDYLLLCLRESGY
jgi:hypothetical protein